MTKDEKKALVQQVYPGLEGIALEIAIGRVKDGDTAATYKQRNPEAPQVLKGEVPFTPGSGSYKAAAKGFQIVKDAVEALVGRGVDKAAAAKIAEIPAELAQAAENGDATAQQIVNGLKAGDYEGAANAAKGSKSKAALKWLANHKKISIPGALIGGTAVINSVSNSGGGSKKAPTDTTVTSDTKLSVNGKLADSVLQSAAANSTDLASTLLNIQGTTNLSADEVAYLQKKYKITATSSDKKIGVWTGSDTPEVKGTTKIPLKTGLDYATITPGKSGFQDLTQYKQSFPIGDQEALNAFYKKVTGAGFSVDQNDPTGSLRKYWDSLGQLSVDASKQGRQLTPDQALAMQAAFANGGGNAGPTVNTTYSPTSKEDVKKLLNAQLQKLTGRTASDSDLEAFYNKVHGIEMKKGTKTVTTTTGKTSKTVVTPGYGQNEILAEAEKVAQQDPMYKQLQSSNVFGDALSQALGVK
jgi:hypothetical protein